MEHLATIFENLEEERQKDALENRNRSKRLKDKKLTLRDPLDLIEKKQQFNEQQSSFKNNVQRYTEPIYKILDARPVDLGEGPRTVKYAHTDKKEKVADFTHHGHTTVKNRFHHVPPCVLDSTHCSLDSRRQSKINNQQQYNSVLQMGSTFFKTRNFDEQFKRTTEEFPSKKFNIDKSNSNGPKFTAFRGGKSIDGRDQSSLSVHEEQGEKKNSMMFALKKAFSKELDKVKKNVTIDSSAQKANETEASVQHGQEGQASTIPPDKTKEPFSKTFDNILNVTLQSTAKKGAPFRAYPDSALDKAVVPSYLGTYSKTFQQSFSNGSYRRKSTAATF